MTQRHEHLLVVNPGLPQVVVIRQNSGVNPLSETAFRRHSCR
jgi:hypothetical protein